jgi:hypothetical protein
MARRDSGLLAILGIGALGAWYFLKRPAAAAIAVPGGASSSGAASDAASYPAAALAPLPGSLAPTLPAIVLSGSFWDSLTPTSPESQGFVNFPSGSQAAAALLTTRMDGLGNLYVQWAGQTYQLSGPDQFGNYTATLSTS